MVGSGLGAEHFVLFKGGDVIEEAAKITTVLFDKTGTLTLGKPKVTDLYLTKRNGLHWLLLSLF